jgi:heme/copper-type cytochrome/quinol oxidase subunit 2
MTSNTAIALTKTTHYNNRSTNKTTNWKHNRGLEDWSTLGIIIIVNLRTAAFKAYCAISVRRSNFRHQASPRVSPRESTQRRKVELWAKNVREF